VEAEADKFLRKYFGEKSSEAFDFLRSRGVEVVKFFVEAEAL